jgi:hypothetical protein
MKQEVRVGHPPLRTPFLQSSYRSFVLWPKQDELKIRLFVELST